MIIAICTRNHEVHGKGESERQAYLDALTNCLRHYPWQAFDYYHFIDGADVDVDRYGNFIGRDKGSAMKLTVTRLPQDS